MIEWTDELILNLNLGVSWGLILFRSINNASRAGNLESPAFFPLINERMIEWTNELILNLNRCMGVEFIQI